MTKTVLLVEDDLGYLDHWECMLSLSGVTSRTATNALEAISMFDEHPHVDAIVLDGSLGKGDSYFPILRYIRSRGFAGPIIAASGDQWTRSQQLLDGCTDEVQRKFEVPLAVKRVLQIS